MVCSRYFLVLLVCLYSIQDGRGQGDRRQRNREKQRQRLAELSRSSTSFAVTLYRQLSTRNNDNVIFSPLSVFTALSMTLLGSQGETKNQIKRVLAQRPRQGIHRALHAVFASFPNSPDANVTLRVANAAYYDDRQISLADSFIRNTRMFYGAYPKVFQRPDPETPINDWVSHQTGGMIQDFLSQGEITDDMVLLLLNAVYFEGTWEHIFDERSTRDGDFTTSSGHVVRVPMMSRDGQYAVKEVGEGLATRVLELPYGTDGRFSMFILLPERADGLRQLESRLNSQVLEEAVTNMPDPMRFMITVPKFSMRLKTSMKDILQAMGLTRLFSDDAELQRMVRDSPGRLAVSDVMHEAVIEVNERGTKAAAVTSVGIVLLSLPPQFTVNHPFLLVLRDNKAGLNLFLGRVNDPTQGDA